MLNFVNIFQAFKINESYSAHTFKRFSTKFLNYNWLEQVHLFYCFEKDKKFILAITVCSST